MELMNSKKNIVLTLMDLNHHPPIVNWLHFPMCDRPLLNKYLMTSF